MRDDEFDPYLPPRAPVGNLRTKPVGTERVDGNPWLTIWTRPRGTIRSIVDTDPSRSVILLSVLSGIGSTLSNALSNNSGDQMSLVGIIALALIGGSIGGIIGNLLFGALFRWTGSWLGGVATFDEARAAVAWGSVPNVVPLVLLIGVTAIFGQDIYKSVNLEAGGNEKAFVLIGLGLVQVVLGIWGVVLLVKCLAEVHQFSGWRSLGAILLASLVFVGVIFVIVFVGIAAYMGMKGGA